MDGISSHLNSNISSNYTLGATLQPSVSSAGSNSQTSPTCILADMVTLEGDGSDSQTHAGALPTRFRMAEVCASSTPTQPIGSAPSSTGVQQTSGDSPTSASQSTSVSEQPQSVEASETSSSSEASSSAVPAQTSETETTPESEAPARGLKKVIRNSVNAYKRAADSPITFIKDTLSKESGNRKKVAIGVPTAIALGIGAAAFLTSELDEEQVEKISDVKDVAVDGATMGGGIKKNTRFYSGLANLIGANEEAFCAVGGTVLAGRGVVKIAKGTKRIINGIRKKDTYELARGARTAFIGARYILNGAVVGTTKMVGKFKKASDFVRNSVLPKTRAVAGGLNIAVGATTMKKGIQEKSKKKIISAALDLAYGAAVIASVAVGGPVAAVACTGLSAAKTGWSIAQKAGRYIKRDREIQAERRAAQDPSGLPNSEQSPSGASANQARIPQVASGSLAMSTSYEHTPTLLPQDPSGQNGEPISVSLDSTQDGADSQWLISPSSAQDQSTAEPTTGSAGRPKLRTRIVDRFIDITTDSDDTKANSNGDSATSPNSTAPAEGRTDAASVTFVDLEDDEVLDAFDDDYDI